MNEKIVTDYTDIFKTEDPKDRSMLDKHIKKLRELDQFMPHSATFFCVTNTTSRAFEYVSKNFTSTLRLPIEKMCEEGMTYWWSRMHPTEMDKWLKSLSDLMVFTLNEIPLEDRKRMTYTWNYRIKDGNDEWKSVIQNTTPMLFDEEGKPIIGLAHYSVFESYEDPPIQASAKYLNDKNEYETVYYQFYGGQKLLAESITNRERDVLRLLSYGFSNDEIGKKLTISESTVKTHRKNVMLKTGCKTITELVAQTIRNGLI